MKKEELTILSKDLNTRYIITEKTFVLAPEKTVDNKVFTRVMEREKTLIVSKKPIHIVTRSCAEYGSDYTTALKASKVLFGNNRQKSPILLANSYGTPYIFIPTLSPQSDQNVWIAYHAIDLFNTDGLGTSVYFDNGQRFKTEISAPTLYRQYALARMIEKDFLKKREMANRSFFFFPANERPNNFPTW
ncbi:competence protein ComK [Sporosarcina highlanderae]|uniref:Competence protein ComK n=1 Tax=Sporosarcina highlanderae TaxID=3035916 RepID=A0ABT8JP03_9BACL|nr:competence protein ComK [Sporosarcina highlanderae]MDN4606762.1 competence protein ComK [Sporosarcina highlanderae]